MKYYIGNLKYYIKKKPGTFIFWGIVVLLLSLYIFKNYLRPVENNPFIDKSSIHYVNKLYQSDGLIYETLSENVKELYLDMLSDTRKNKPTRRFKIGEYGCKDPASCNGMVNSAYEALFIDHPELLSFGVYRFRQKTDTEVEITYKNAIQFKWLVKIHEMRIRRIIDDIKKDTENLSDYEKVKYVYDWISTKTYDKMFTYSATNQTAYNVFIKDKAVCAGFAKASQIIFQNIGIESYIVLGSTRGAHAWNIVKVNDKYYQFDSTVGSSLRDDSKRFYMGLSGPFNNYSMSNQKAYPEFQTELLKPESN